jgi:putative phage-type endonuclease
MTAPVVIPVVQRSPEWIEARRSGIGASEAGAAIGISRWTSPYALWCDKLGLTTPEEQTPAMLLGELMEPVLADLAGRELGESLRRRNHLLRHAEHPWMLASLDRVRPGRRGLVELKHTARGDGYGDPGTDEVPDDVLAQCVHQMAVADAPSVDVFALVGGRAPIRRYTILRDPDAEAALIEAEREFWRHVETRTAPPLSGSASDLDALAAQHPADDGATVTLEAGHPVAAALAALRDVRETQERAKTDESRLRAVIEAEMAEASVLTVPGVGRVTWKASRTSPATDWAAVARALGEAYPAALAAAVASNTTPAGTGSRRFVPSWEGASNE